MIPPHVLVATARCEDAIGELNRTSPSGSDHAYKCAVAAFVRQHLICTMAMLEQTGIDAALHSALQAYDHRLAQEGLKP